MTRTTVDRIAYTCKLNIMNWAATLQYKHKANMGKDIKPTRPPEDILSVSLINVLLLDWFALCIRVVFAYFDCLGRLA